MKKIASILLISVFLATNTTVSFVSADQNAMTNLEFADLLIRVTGIELPAGSENLSEAEYFEVVSNIFAVRGLDYWVGKDPYQVMSSTDMAEVLYTIVGGIGGLSPEQKLTFLVNGGFIAEIGAGSVITLAYATGSLNNPAFVGAIAEAYSAADALERAGSEAPGFKFEETASVT